MITSGFDNEFVIPGSLAEALAADQQGIHFGVRRQSVAATALWLPA